MTVLAIRPSQDLGAVRSGPSMQQAIERRNLMVDFVQTIMKKDVDFGKVPGTEKDTLLKPGAEKLCTFFGMTVRFQITEKVEDWSGDEHGGEPLFYYVYRCQLWKNEELVAESDGSCNSRESKYRWRWVRESEIPAGQIKSKLATRSGSIREPDFAIRKAETGGKYGKPASYWQRFVDAIESGQARQMKWQTGAGKEMSGWEIGETMYRVPNEDAPSQINTIQKMAQKRALVGTTLLAVNASEFFTQDLDDMDFIDGAAYSTPTTYQPPAPDPDTEFLREWDEVISARGFSASSGRNLLGSCLKKRKIGLEEADASVRRALIDAAKSGAFDKLAKNGNGHRDESPEPPLSDPGPQADAPAVSSPDAGEAQTEPDQPPAPAGPGPVVEVDPGDIEYETWCQKCQEAAQDSGVTPSELVNGINRACLAKGCKGDAKKLPADVRKRLLGEIAGRTGYFAKKA